MAVLLVCAAISESAHGAPPGKFIVYGSGAKSCGKWLAVRSGGDYDLQLQWVLGWFSAAGFYDVHGDLRDTDSDAITAWLDKYCRENPLKGINDAAAQLVRTLSKAHAKQ